MSNTSVDSATALSGLTTAVQAGKVTESAAANIKIWLTEPRYAEYAPQVAEHIAQEKWQALDDVFWTVIPFGTGGRRGRMYPIGSNAINDRTIGESAQGLANYVKEFAGGAAGLSCGIAYDTRHKSEHFARLCAEIMVAAGFQVHFLQGYRSTPELSFLIRYKKCSCGIMVTASHNPPSDNAVKCYWSTGGQILPPHDKAVIDRVMNVDEIKRVDFDQALAEGKIELCQDEVDPAFIAAVRGERFEGPRDAKILYSPLHGVGASAVVPALQADGFGQVEVFGPHAEPDGDFPNVPGHVSNPENPAVFDAIIEQARRESFDLILATDPDCDRVGCAAPLTLEAGSDWKTFTGNQIAALLADFVLEERRAAGRLSPDHYVVTTLVTTGMLRRIAESYNVRILDNLLVGFKWIAGVMDEQGPDNFVFGCEESHGYLVGQYARDKDAAVASMLLAELAAKLKAQGQTLHNKIEALYWQHGYHLEGQISRRMEGSQGMELMQRLMNSLRQDPPRELAGIQVASVRDYLKSTEFEPGGQPQPLVGPVGDVVFLELAKEGNRVAVRPSGTEPKVKFYLFNFEAPEQLADLESSRQELARLQQQIGEDLGAYVERVTS